MRKYQKKSIPPPHSIWTNPIHFIACGFGFGTFPYFPGTIGTLLAIPLTIFLSRTTLQFYIVAVVLLFLIGMYVCNITNRDFGTDDHPAAIIDEIATFPIVMILIPMNWYFLLIGFLLFRFFDIVKPFPIRWIDKNVHGGFGVMLDDLLAAIFSWIILHIILILL
ncbi:MAG TPA: phosphatidylglycerophosphatase A [Coxiellaceae bacterium]|nr:phosphatidylglycerophosphatase A [Coxiellaceae bacterium]